MCKNVRVVKIDVEPLAPSTAWMITGYGTCHPSERNNEMGHAVFVKLCNSAFSFLEESWGIG